MFKQDLLRELLEDMGMMEDQVSGPLFRFREMILDWNDKINLTAITDEEEMYLKHFIDSYLIIKTDLNLNKRKILDLGTGAGFPGIPLALYFKNSDFTLVDSLARRITFLERVVGELGLKNVTLIHGRAEDLAKLDEHRERYDLVISRAVAELPVLLEYALPFVKKGGDFVAYKGSQYVKELENSHNALELLGGEIGGTFEFELPLNHEFRVLIQVHKVMQTPFRYPRKPGKASKNPL
jgi:16S rRNA (guanine527-N7)-methyltransferase